MKTYAGGCHCGKVRYEVKTGLERVMECNCSHCAMKGLLLAFVPADDFLLLKGEDSMAVYHFNKGTIDHMFCTACGVEAFGKGNGPKGEMRAVNVRTIDGIDLDSLALTPFDGKAL